PPRARVHTRATRSPYTTLFRSLTVSVGAAVAPGVYNLTVAGSASAGNRSTPLSLTVSAAPDYALSLAPAALTIGQGATGTSTVTDRKSTRLNSSHLGISYAVFC